MHDVLIIGAGPAGLAAALWCDELGLDTLVLEQAEATRRPTSFNLQPHRELSGVSVKSGRAFLDFVVAKT